MNAPAKIPSKSRAAYKPSIERLLPGCVGEELEMRAALLLMRDNATIRLRACSDEAAPILNHIARLASDCAFTSMPIAELTELRRQLVMLTACASGLEGIAYRLANPSAGGCDARGR